MTLTILFVVSLCLLSVLLGTKMYAVSHDKMTNLEKFLSRFDEVILSYQNTVHETYVHKRNYSTNYVRRDLPKRVLATIEAVRAGAKAGYKAAFPNIRGVRVLRTSRDASEFLQHISRAQEINGKGRIEDGPLS